MCLYLFLFKCYGLFCLFIFNAVAGNTSVYYKHEVCLITIIKTSVLIYMPFLKWVFYLPSGVIEYKFGLYILYVLLAPLFQELFCSWLLSILKFIQCGWQKIKHALYFVLKQTLCFNSYGLQVALMRLVPGEGLRLKLSSINISRRWRNGALSLVRGSGKNTTVSGTTLFSCFYFCFLREETHIIVLKLLVYNLREVCWKVI